MEQAASLVERGGSPSIPAQQLYFHALLMSFCAPQGGDLVSEPSDAGLLDARCKKVEDQLQILVFVTFTCVHVFSIQRLPESSLLPLDNDDGKKTIENKSTAKIDCNVGVSSRTPGSFIQGSHLHKNTYLCIGCICTQINLSIYPLTNFRVLHQQCKLWGTCS